MGYGRFKASGAGSILAAIRSVTVTAQRVQVVRLVDLQLSTTDLGGMCSRSCAVGSGLGSAVYAARQQSSVRIGSPSGARSHNRS